MINFQFSAEILKRDDVKKQVSGVVYRANTIDSQGDFMTPETLERMAHAALAKGIIIDTNHNGKDSGAKLVESHIENGDTLICKIQLTDALHEDVVAGKYRAFSFGGVGKKIAKVYEGREVYEITAADMKYISLVDKGANGEQFILKNDTSAEVLAEAMASIMSLKKGIAELQEDINATRETLATVNGTGTASTVRKQAEEEAAVKKELTIDEVATELRIKQRMFEDNWLNYHAPGAADREKRLLIEIEQLEARLEALREPVAKSVFDAPERSAFSHRGGTSQHLDTGKVFPGNDSAYSRPARRISKAAEDAVSLNDLKI